MLPLCEAVSRRLCRWLTGWDMTPCAHAWIVGPVLSIQA